MIVRSESDFPPDICIKRTAERTLLATAPQWGNPVPVFFVRTPVPLLPRPSDKSVLPPHDHLVPPHLHTLLFFPQSVLPVSASVSPNCLSYSDEDEGPSISPFLPFVPQQSFELPLQEEAEFSSYSGQLGRRGNWRQTVAFPLHAFSKRPDSLSPKYKKSPLLSS